jgi:DHA1 family bicyclomycin/chloramphenicol resistance-like MFS transporter
VLGAGGWRAIYATLGATGAALAAVVACGLPETHRPQRGHALVGGFLRVFRDRHCMGYALVNTLTFAGMFAFIANSSLVFIGDFGISVAVFGGLFAFASLGLVLGSWTNGWLAHQGVAAHVPLWGGLLAAFAAGAVPLALQLSVGVGPYGLIVFMVFATSSRGLVNPNAMAGAMEGLPEVAGAVSATLGCLQSLGMALSSMLVALLHPALGPAAMTGVMSACTLAALGAMAMVARRRGARLLQLGEAGIHPPASPARRTP